MDLFDVVHDRENTTNLAGDPRFAGVKAELLAELYRVLGAMHLEPLSTGSAQPA